MPSKYKSRLSKLKPKLYLSISSEGYGHSSRAIAIAKEFKANEVVIGTYGYAYDKINNFNIPCIMVPQELKLVGSDGSFDVGKTIIKNHSWALTFNQLIYETNKYGVHWIHVSYKSNGKNKKEVLVSKWNEKNRKYDYIPYNDSMLDIIK